MTRGLAGLPQPGRCLVMGILNVTPDSFSDGGLFLEREVAVAHGLALAAAGADLVDVGGESTRPGAERVPVSVEADRVLPVVRTLAEAGVLVSVDTMRAEIADAAVRAGAVLVNDVSGGLADEQMLATVADHGSAYVAMHWRGPSRTMQARAHYDDVVAEVYADLAARAAAATAAGIATDRLALDPGLGFAKTADHNWELLDGLARLQALGHPLLVGTSRKRFLGELLAEGGELREPSGRDAATTATTALLAAQGVWCVRVHDVAGSRDAVRVARRWGSGQHR